MTVKATNRSDNRKRFTLDFDISPRSDLQCTLRPTSTMIKTTAQTDDFSKIEITHVCGHVQVCTKERKLLRAGMERFNLETEDEIVTQLYGYLVEHPCPGCYTWLDKIKG